MTTVKKFYEDIAQSKPDLKSVVWKHDLEIFVGKSDVMAARLLLWLESEMPEDTTQGDLDDVLDSAKWWATFFATIPKPPKEVE